MHFFIPLPRLRSQTTELCNSRWRPSLELTEFAAGWLGAWFEPWKAALHEGRNHCATSAPKMSHHAICLGFGTVFRWQPINEIVSSLGLGGAEFELGTLDKSLLSYIPPSHNADLHKILPH